MQKRITSTLLVAGMCIGGGTIAIPMVLAKIGIIPSAIITILVWFLNYYPSLIGMDLNLRSDRGLSLGTLGKIFSGRGAQIAGELSVKILSYAALTMYLCGSSSIIQKLLEVYFQCEIPIVAIESVIAAAGVILLFFPFKAISYINNIMFVGFIVIFTVLLGTMLKFTDYSNMPWIVQPTFKDVLSVCPVIFASFGYQLILHTLRDYNGRNAESIKKSIFTGSFGPALVYIVWTATSLNVILNSNPEFFSQLVTGKIEIGEFVKELATISSLSNFQILVWWMSILAILTSYVGVGIGLAESMNMTLEPVVKKCVPVRKILAAVATIGPAYIVAVIDPDAFIKILGFVGAMVATIGILVPTYLIFKAGFEGSYYKELKKWPLIACVIGGFVIILAEFFINN